MLDESRMELISLGTQLSEVAIRNTGAIISDKIKTAKAKKNNEETIIELESIISQLIKDKTELVQIGRAYEDELALQIIAPEDIEYITDNLLPVVKDLFKYSGGTNKQIAEIDEMLSILKPILSAQTLTILQLLGFNFKGAIGEPLTLLIRSFILSKEIKTESPLSEMLTPEFVEILKNKSAYENFHKLMEQNL